MKIRIVVIGTPRRDLHRGIVSDHLRRLGPVWPTEIISVPEERLGRAPNPRVILRTEAARIRPKCPAGWPIVALDRTGRPMDSSTVAEALQRWQDTSVRGVVALIGGPLGLDEELVKQSALRLSFGPMTFSHDLALAMLTEQLYRAMSIVKGWPYHR